MSRVITVFAAFAGLAIAGWILFSYWAFTYEEPDPLCAMTKKFNLQCTLLASKDLFDRGAQYLEAPSPMQGNENEPPLPAPPLGIPRNKVFADSCAVSLADKLPALPEKSNQVIQLAEVEYKVRYDSIFGLKAKFPQLEGLTLSLGPKANKLRAFKVKADRAELLQYDKNEFLNMLKSCRLRSSCSRTVSSPESRFIKSVLVARNLQYEITDDKGSSLDLSTALKDDIISVNAGAGITESLIQKLSSGSDLVVGVELFDKSEIQNLNVCDKRWIISNLEGDTAIEVSSPDDTPNNDANFIQPEQDDCQLGSAANKMGKETCASIRHEIEDRKSNEGYWPAYAVAWATTNFEDGVNSFKFLSGVRAWAGTRYNNQNQTPFQFPYAPSLSKITHKVNFQVANREDKSLSIAATLQAATTAPRTDAFNTAVDTYRAMKIAIEKNGATEEKSFIWSQFDNRESQEIVTLDTGETAKISVEYNFKVNVRAYEQNGPYDDDVTLTIQ